MKKIYFLFILFLNACATYSSGYIPNVDLKKNNIILNNDKKDITFSISYYSQVGHEESASIQKKMMMSVRETFKNSQLFRKIHYVPFDNKGKYHYHFDMKLTGTPPNEQVAKGMLSGYTLMLFPMKMNFYVDTTMFLYVNGEEVYSVTSPEIVNDLYWLPMIVAVPFFNHSTVSTYVIDKNMDYFVSKIIENNLY